jgi:hypothetical protein
MDIFVHIWSRIFAGFSGYWRVMTDDQTRLWQSFVVVVVGAIAYYSGALDEILEDFGFETVSAQTYELIEKGKETKFESIGELESGNQRKFTELVGAYRKDAESQKSDAQKKHVWIQANKELCAGNLVLPNKNWDWIGKVVRISARDNGDIRLKVRISHGIDVSQSISSSGLIKVVLPLVEGDFVRFSGFFRRGDMSENECIDTNSMFSAPEIVRENLKFKFTDLERLDVKRL